jgi:neutral ceramidase
MMQIAWRIPLMIAFLVSIALPSRLVAADFLVGVAVADITPPAGYRMCGYFNERLNTGTHDPLQAKALYLRQGDTQGALVFCDLIGLAPDVSARARQTAEKQTGIPAANILIHGTHTHTGPLYEGALRRHFHVEAVKKFGKDPHEVVDYPALLVERLVVAITEARAGARPAAPHAGVATQRGLSFNRRFHMKDGTVVFNPGKLNPNIIRPAGPIDTDLGIVLMKSPDGKENQAILSNFALHLDTVGGTEYGADYPFTLERTLRSRLGNGLVSFFGTGTCGDINHVDVTNNLPQKGHEEAGRIGGQLAETIQQALTTLKPVEAPRLAVVSGRVEVPMQQYTPDEVARAGENMFKIGTSALPFLEQVKANKIMELGLYGGKSLVIEVQAFRLSDDMAIVGLPGEVFVDLGQAIKRGSPFARTLVIELCNDSPAYIPTKKAFVEGSYETVNSLIAPGGGEAMVDLALGLLKDLKAAP